MTGNVLLWIVFGVTLIVMLAIDLGVSGRRKGEMPLKSALLWSGVWIGVALAFNVGVYFVLGLDKAVQFLTGYLIEKSLSVDNIFVFVLIFGSLGIPAKYQRRVLLWGIVGALVMRAILIALGVTLISTFHWIIYVFGLLLVFTGIKLYFEKREAIEIEKHLGYRMLSKFVPISPEFDGNKFFSVKNGQRVATPLLVAVVLVELTDLVFAVDSIPAIFAITEDPFIVYTSNMFAILGLRALYFALAGVIRKFRYLHAALSIILIFVGIKMLMIDIYKIPTGIALGVVAVIMIVAIIASIMRPEKADLDVPEPDSEKISS